MEKPHQKQKYEKPQIRTIELAAEEALGFGCGGPEGVLFGVCGPGGGCNTKSQ